MEQSGSASQPPREGSALRRVARDAEAGASQAWGFAQQRVLPTLKPFATRVGDWLATVGWGKFILVALLALAIAGIATAILYDEPAIIVERGPGTENVKVDVRVTGDGIHIERPGRPKPPVPPKPPVAPKGVVAPVPPVPPASPKGTINIDENGVRISADRDGKPVQVIIDGSGVRVEERSSKVPDKEEEDDAVAITAPDGSIIIPNSATTDPTRVEQALDTVRAQIEELVEQQVDRQVARETRRYRAKGSDWLMSFVVLLILTGIIVKVVLGGKKKAERRAQVATATAAEESLKRQLVEAQLKMMQAQVEPHFLFNTLASVDYLIETDPPTASKMQKNLIQYLRAALPQMREGSTTLGKEIQLCRSYLEILRFRMEDRLRYSVTVPQGLLSAQFPPMMLQSLVENSIKHGLEPKPEGGSITISADIANGRLRVTVADTGLGFAAAATAGSGVGLSNVRERLAALYGGSARLSVEANAVAGTIVTIEVPYTFEADAPMTPAPQPA